MTKTDDILDGLREPAWKGCPIECPILKLYHEADNLADEWEKKYNELIREIRSKLTNKKK
ncbi:hypothetical protein LCGC14_1205820 [marine sediment metagenome]|uniref:Uncharacterized protein n=1 Tax=marine sediment metagenome TaxID=412755 RepID=A0A0F9M2X9_9ZZZZ